MSKAPTGKDGFERERARGRRLTETFKNKIMSYEGGAGAGGKDGGRTYLINDASIFP
jgi:hypothetical protein